MKTRLVVIGGVAGGATAAARALKQAGFADVVNAGGLSDMPS